MSSYCPSSEVTPLLPPSSVGTGTGQITTAQLTTAIEAGSALVDSRLGGLYWPFTAYCASPATSPPWIVRQAAAYYSAAHALDMLQSLNANLDESLQVQRFEKAEALLKPYIEGTQQIAPVSTSQLLHSTSWGDGDPLTTSQAYLTVTEAEIIVDSATITNYIYGDDFVVYYLPNHRRYVVEKYDSNIGAAVTPSGDTITFEYSFLKKRETVTPGIRQIEIIRG